MIQRKGTPHEGKGHHMEGRVTTWREGSPHGGKGHHMEGRVTTWREVCNDSKEGYTA